MGGQRNRITSSKYGDASEGFSTWLVVEFDDHRALSKVRPALLQVVLCRTSAQSAPILMLGRRTFDRWLAGPVATIRFSNGAFSWAERPPITGEDCR